jgi:hypothetical protein
MNNILHTASSPGLRDSLNPARRRRILGRRRRETTAIAPARPPAAGAPGLAAPAGLRPQL